MVLRFNRFIYLILGKKQTLYLSAYFIVDQVGVPPALRLPAELRRINFSSPYYCGPGGSSSCAPPTGVASEDKLLLPLLLWTRWEFLLRSAYRWSFGG